MSRPLSALLALTVLACGGSEAPAPAPPPAPTPPPVAKAPEPPPAPAPEPTDPMEIGKKIYETNCQACHGPDGKGNNGMAASYVDDPARLAQPDDVLIKSIKDGKTGTIGAMPPWGAVLSDDQVKAVLGYIRTSFGKTQP